MKREVMEPAFSKEPVWNDSDDVKAANPNQPMQFSVTLFSLVPRTISPIHVVVGSCLDSFIDRTDSFIDRIDSFIDRGEMSHASRRKEVSARALRQVMALNNMSASLLERSCPKDARATVRDALDLVRKLSDLASAAEEDVGGLRNEPSWLVEIEAFTDERMRRAGKRLSQSSKTATCTACGWRPWEVLPIFLDHRAPDPALQRLLSTDEEGALDRRIYPIKMDVFAESEDASAIPEDVVSAISLYNYSLALMADDDSQYCRTGSGAHKSATRLLLMAMELTYQRLDASGDVSEQLGLHTLAILAVRTMIVLHQDSSESRDVYRRSHRGLLDRARALASLEALLFGPKQETAAAA